MTAYILLCLTTCIPTQTDTYPSRDDLRHSFNEICLTERDPKGAIDYGKREGQKYPGYVPADLLLVYLGDLDGAGSAAFYAYEKHLLECGEKFPEKFYPAFVKALRSSVDQFKEYLDTHRTPKTEDERQKLFETNIKLLDGVGWPFFFDFGLMPEIVIRADGTIIERTWRASKTDPTAATRLKALLDKGLCFPDDLLDCIRKLGPLDDATIELLFDCVNKNPSYKEVNEVVVRALTEAGPRVLPRAIALLHAPRMVQTDAAPAISWLMLRLKVYSKDVEEALNFIVGSAVREDQQYAKTVQNALKNASKNAPLR